jgi:hypothetical protein
MLLGRLLLPQLYRESVLEKKKKKSARRYEDECLVSRVDTSPPPKTVSHRKESMRKIRTVVDIF